MLCSLSGQLLPLLILIFSLLATSYASPQQRCLEPRGITDFPPEFHQPPPPSWAGHEAAWARFQRELASGYSGCMPNCCGRRNCYGDPAALRDCQAWCLKTAYATGSAMHPVTGKLAPMPPLAQAAGAAVEENREAFLN
ncbi:hypothetical protein FN846DRAFT_917097 [Sphaerosporella brunnea]|uniref:Invertebrate defensins family profile domain-containing protein n=1 Tax=Sphaerosporella brunnea TaxID=1250544 RepID=A0A5J5F4H8_9PEZI|nr:hypothetical protein FN846DRAFT_917097 [Sphaerosporella brunnea]